MENGSGNNRELGKLHEKSKEEYSIFWKDYAI